MGNENTKAIEAMSIEELRKDLQAACYDYDTIKAQGTTGPNAWSLVWISRRIDDLKAAIDKHDKRLEELQRG